VAGTKGTKASAAMRNRLFMGRILCVKTESFTPRHDV